MNTKQQRLLLDKIHAATKDILQQLDCDILPGQEGWMQAFHLREAAVGVFLFIEELSRTETERCKWTTIEGMNHPADRCKFMAVTGGYCLTHAKKLGLAR